VPEKEGRIRPVASIYEFWDRQHKRIVLLDNNFLALPTWKEILLEIGNEPVSVDFNQGLDIRLIDDEKAWHLKQLRAKQLRFAFDDMIHEKAVRKGIELLIKAGIRSRKLSFYVLVGYDGDDTAIERMKILQSYNVDVFPMVYKGSHGKEPETAKESLRKIRTVVGVEGIFWHGSRRNINKFLRVIGRLPE